MKVTNLVEQIFAQAVALDQSGGLKNTIYCIDNSIYIMNYDHTVLLHFRLRNNEGKFEQPISFKANDYDSNEFEELDGKIVFTSQKGDYVRKKTCGTSDITPAEVKEIFKNFLESETSVDTITISRDCLELLDSDLSHIEFSGAAGESIKMVQRNIYSGGIVEITQVNDGLLADDFALKADFGPVGIKTDDFKALFNFQDALKFSFPSKEKEDIIVVRSSDTNKRNMTGIVACCLYDEIIKIKESRDVEPKRTR